MLLWLLVGVARDSYTVLADVCSTRASVKSDPNHLQPVSNPTRIYAICTGSERASKQGTLAVRLILVFRQLVYGGQRENGTCLSDDVQFLYIADIASD